jgi:hypothetical protein
MIKIEHANHYRERERERERERDVSRMKALLIR